MNPGTASKLRKAQATSDRWDSLRPALSRTVRHVFKDLILGTGRDGVCRYAHATIAESCGMSISSVRRALSVLASWGWITVQIHPGGVNAYAVGGVLLEGQGGALPEGQGGALPEGQRSSTYQVSIPGAARGHKARQPRKRIQSDPTPTGSPQTPTDGKPLRDYLGGRSWRSQLPGGTDEGQGRDTASVAAEYQRTNEAMQGGAGGAVSLVA